MQKTGTWFSSKWIQHISKSVQFVLKSFPWSQNWTKAQLEFNLKSQVRFQTKIAQHEVQLPLLPTICIGNSMICSDVKHKYHEWYFEIVMLYTKFHEPLSEWNLRQFEILQVAFMPNITYKSCYYLFTLTLRKSLVIFTCRYFQLSRNTTARSQSNCRHFSCSSIRFVTLNKIWKRFGCAVLMFLFHWLGKRCDLEQKMVWFGNKSHCWEPIRFHGSPVISKWM